MSAAHTPGPWGVEKTDTRMWVGPMRADGGKVADIVAPIEWGRDYRPDFLAKQEANARLIAAAPELLAELQRLLDLVDRNDVATWLATEHPAEWANMGDAVGDARAAIAKASPPVMKGAGK